MKVEKIKKARELAREFILRTDELDKAVKKHLLYQSPRLYCENAPKQSGALRRSSMELTRALAEMRRP